MDFFLLATVEPLSRDTKLIEDYLQRPHFNPFQAESGVQSWRLWLTSTIELNEMKGSNSSVFFPPKYNCFYGYPNTFV